MNGSRKSDKSIVPKKRANKFTGAPVKAESVEGRDLAKENSVQQNSFRAQHRAELQIALDRIRQKAAEDKEMRFTSLCGLCGPCPECQQDLKLGVSSHESSS